ncbi:PTS sugar transporter subunit IIB [Flaviflexus ciconiae]|uniref:PTS sugar transporter subunit IIB n=1 Tax=Flaviflexus ciconiae TaxID=2496867 RepID=A0A3Q9G3R2_9ACTO|nr:glucose PTS transporter subunit EIIB [Flaviflexus ciconiae]AZQ77015.1 PTS sugar transporter subunit IIB [Flaviflexus ciconiae]
MDKAQSIIAGLGGKDNISTVEACITRIRAVVNSVDAVSEEALRESGAFGVVVQANNVVQVVVGPEAEDIVERMG